MLRVLAIAFIACCEASAQTPVSFEAASVKQSLPIQEGERSGAIGGPGTTDPGRWRCRDCSLSYLFYTAYDVHPFQVVRPKWLETASFDISAKLPPGTSKPALHIMLRNLLAESFGLRLHQDRKVMPVYRLVLAKNGPRLKPPVESVAPKDESRPLQPIVEDKDGYPIVPSGFTMILETGGPSHLEVPRESMDEFANRLAGLVERPVINATGLKGRYSFSLSWVDTSFAPADPPPEDSFGPSLFTALDRQLGLKLLAAKRPADILVIDHAERTPSGN